MIYERVLLRWWARYAGERKLPLTVLATVGVILTRADRSTGCAWPSRPRIMQESGIRSRAALDRALRLAVAHGLIVRQRRGGGLSNVYRPGPALTALSDGPSTRSDALPNGPLDGLRNRPLTATENGFREEDPPYPPTAPSDAGPTPSRETVKTGEGGSAPAAEAEDPGDGSSKPDLERWRRLWNELAAAHGLVSVRPAAGWSETRRAALSSRLREHGPAAAEKVLRAPAERPFLRGENPRGWLANFDWLLKPTNFEKVLEGNYSTTTPRRKARAASDDAYLRLNPGVDQWLDELDAASGAGHGGDVCN